MKQTLLWQADTDELIQELFKRKLLIKINNSQIPIEIVKELCRQSEMWELNNPRVIAMLNNIFKCINDEENLDDDSKETFINIVFSNLIIYTRYDLNKV